FCSSLPFYRSFCRRHLFSFPTRRSSDLFESLLGLFTLSRLGLLGQGNALIFFIVGVILVVIQVRFIGPWSRRYGERRLVFAALRSEEHTSELQSRENLVCRLLLEKKNLN